MKKRQKSIPWFLLLCLAFGLLAGCGTGEKPEQTTALPFDSSAGTTVGGEVTEATTELPFRIFAKRKVIVGGQGSFGDRVWLAWPTESAQEAEKQAIYDKLQDDLQISLEYVKPDSVEDMGVMLANLMAGDLPCDIICLKLQRWMPLAIKGLILPFDDPRIVRGGLDVNDSSVFFQPYTQAQKYSNKVYGVMWNGEHFLCEFGWCIYFNKQLIADAGVPDLYQVVRDGKWDWDFFRHLAKEATKDYDGDNVPDVYGVGTFGYGSELFTKPGAEIIRNEGGVMKVALHEPGALEALEFTRLFAHVDQVRHPDDYGPVHRQFTDGKVAMVWGEQKNTRASDLGFQATNINYGLVPMPKAPQAGEYVNVLGGVYSFNLFSSMSDTDIEDMAYILAELGRRFTNDDWQATYRDVDLRGDAEALEMVVDYIWPNTVVDYVWASDTVRECFRQNIYLPMTEGQGSPVQLVEQYKNELQAEVDALFGQ